MPVNQITFYTAENVPAYKQACVLVYFISYLCLSFMPKWSPKYWQFGRKSKFIVQINEVLWNTPGTIYSDVFIHSPCSNLCYLA